MAEWPPYPCKNPHCKSYGHPHPNCRCGIYAGVEVGNFCDSNSTHNKDCEHFVDGGAVGTEVPANEVIPDQVPQEIPASEVIPDQEVPANEVIPDSQNTSPYATTEQQLLTGAEGAAQGIAGPAATAAELGLSKLGVPGLSAEDIAARQQENPNIHTAGAAAGIGLGMLTGTGEIGLLTKGAEAAAKAAELGKIGTYALKGIIESAGLQTGDEISKAMLGQGDPEGPVSAALIHIGAAGLFGGTLGTAAGVLNVGVNKGFSALENAKLGTKATSFLQGIGAGTSEIDPSIPIGDMSAFKAGQKVQENAGKAISQKAIDMASEAGAWTAASTLPGGLITYEVFKNGLSKILGRYAPSIGKTVGKYAPDAAAKALSMGETIGLFNILDHAEAVGKGVQKMNKGIESLFRVGGQQEYNTYTQPSDRDRAKLKSFIEDGGVDKQIQDAAKPVEQPSDVTPSFAEGGDVNQPKPQVNPVTTVFPDQNALMQAAKTRVSNYLNSIRPDTALPSTLPYDKKMKDPVKEKDYNKAIDIALYPLGVLDHVRNGTIQVDHIKHLNSMYPEIYNRLSSQITKRMLEGKVDEDNKPAYKTRQAMSLFLGSPVDSTFTPTGITLAQTTFAPPPPAQPQQPPPKKSSGTTKHSSDALQKLSTQYQTPLQASSQRALRPE